MHRETLFFVFFWDFVVIDDDVWGMNGAKTNYLSPSLFPSLPSSLYVRKAQI